MPKITLGKNKLENAQNVYYDTEENKKNKNFIQLYDNANEYILQLTEQNPTASKIFLFLARFAESNNTIDISIKELASIFKCTDRTIKRAMQTLKEINFLTTIKVGKNNIYFLNPKIVFNNKAQYKTKMLNTYTQYAGTTEIKLNIENIDIKEIDKFKNREKLTYRFKLKYKEFQEPTLEEIKAEQEQIEKLSKSVEELRKQQQDLQAQIMINEQALKIQQEEKRNATFEDLAFNDFDENFDNEEDYF